MSIESIKLKAGDISYGDIERAILPALVCGSDSAGPFRAYALAIGWWRWGIKLIVTVRREI